jgi:hypothetical protein
MKLIFEILPDLTQRKHVYVTIAWQHAGDFYPSSSWVDNADVVLGWWLTSLIRLADGSDSETLTFMEGPYALQLERNSERRSVVMVRSRDGKFSCSVLFRVLGEEVLRASREMLAAVREWTTRPVNEMGFRRIMQTLQERIDLLGP